MKSLSSWLPYDFRYTNFDIRILKHLNDDIVKEYGGLDDLTSTRWSGKRKNVIAWCILSTGYAVGWNENPSVGLSFEICKLK